MGELSKDAQTLRALAKKVGGRVAFAGIVEARAAKELVKLGMATVHWEGGGVPMLGGSGRLVLTDAGRSWKAAA
jgi:hypothetical protein